MDLCLATAPLLSYTGVSLKAAPNSYTGSSPPRPFAGVWQRSALWLTPKKLLRSPRRPFKTTGSRSEKRSQLVASSTRGQPRGQVISSDSTSKRPSRTGVQSKHRGREHGRKAALGIAVPQGCRYPKSRSSLACLRSALWLPGTVGLVPLRIAHVVLPRPQPRHRPAEALAQIHHRRVKRLPR